MIYSAPHLFATAHGTACLGDLRCFFCGAPSDDSRAVRDYVRDSFNDRGAVAQPGSLAVCEGCVLCLREDAEVTYPDGEVRRVTKAAVRMHSWVVTDGRTVAATKAHMPYLRGVCLSPPAPPYVISLAASGQKHLLFRAVVVRGGGLASVTLEGERVDYRPAELAARLALAGRVCAASGKPALAEPPNARLGMAAVARYSDGDRLMAEWCRVFGEPLTRLASFLCFNKEESESVYPGDRPAPVPAQASRAGGRVGRPERGGSPGLFD